MPQRPPTPQVFRREQSAGGEAFPLGAIVGSAPPIFAQSWQIGATFYQTVQVAIPAISAANSNVTVTKSVVLTTFPKALTLLRGQQATITYAVSLLPSNALPLVTVAAALKYGTGNAGTPSFVNQPGTLVGPKTITTPSLSLSLTGYSFAAGTAATNVTVAVQATLIGTLI